MMTIAAATNNQHQQFSEGKLQSKPFTEIWENNSILLSRTNTLLNCKMSELNPSSVNINKEAKELIDILTKLECQISTTRSKIQIVRNIIIKRSKTPECDRNQIQRTNIEVAATTKDMRNIDSRKIFERRNPVLKSPVRVTENVNQIQKLNGFQTNREKQKLDVLIKNFNVIKYLERNFKRWNENAMVTNERNFSIQSPIKDQQLGIYQNKCLQNSPKIIHNQKETPSKLAAEIKKLNYTLDNVITNRIRQGKYSSILSKEQKLQNIEGNYNKKTILPKSRSLFNNSTSNRVNKYNENIKSNQVQGTIKNPQFTSKILPCEEYPTDGEKIKTQQNIISSKRNTFSSRLTPNCTSDIKTNNLLQKYPRKRFIPTKDKPKVVYSHSLEDKSLECSFNKRLEPIINSELNTTNAKSDEEIRIIYDPFQCCQTKQNNQKSKEKLHQAKTETKQLGSSKKLIKTKLITNSSNEIRREKKKETQLELYKPKLLIPALDYEVQVKMTELKLLLNKNGTVATSLKIIENMKSKRKLLFNTNIPTLKELEAKMNREKTFIDNMKLFADEELNILINKTPVRLQITASDNNHKDTEFQSMEEVKNTNCGEEEIIDAALIGLAEDVDIQLKTNEEIIEIINAHSMENVDTNKPIANIESDQNIANTNNQEAETNTDPLVNYGINAETQTLEQKDIFTEILEKRDQTTQTKVKRQTKKTRSICKILQRKHSQPIKEDKNLQNNQRKCNTQEINTKLPKSKKTMTKCKRIQVSIKQSEEDEHLFKSKDSQEKNIETEKVDSYDNKKEQTTQVSIEESEEVLRSNDSQDNVVNKTDEVEIIDLDKVKDVEQQTSKSEIEIISKTTRDTETCMEKTDVDLPQIQLKTEPNILEIDKNKDKCKQQNEFLEPMENIDEGTVLKMITSLKNLQTGLSKCEFDESKIPTKSLKKLFVVFIDFLSNLLNNQEFCDDFISNTNDNKDKPTKKLLPPKRKSTEYAEIKYNEDNKKSEIKGVRDIYLGVQEVLAQGVELGKEFQMHETKSTVFIELNNNLSRHDIMTGTEDKPYVKQRSCTKNKPTAITMHSQQIQTIKYTHSSEDFKVIYDKKDEESKIYSKILHTDREDCLLDCNTMEAKNSVPSTPQKYIKFDKNYDNRYPSRREKRREKVDCGVLVKSISRTSTKRYITSKNKVDFGTTMDLNQLFVKNVPRKCACKLHAKGNFGIIKELLKSMNEPDNKTETELQPRDFRNSFEKYRACRTVTNLMQGMDNEAVNSNRKIKIKPMINQKYNIPKIVRNNKPDFDVLGHEKIIKKDIRFQSVHDKLQDHVSVDADITQNSTSAPKKCKRQLVFEYILPPSKRFTTPRRP